MVECASCQLGFFSDSIGLTMSIHKLFGFILKLRPLNSWCYVLVHVPGTQKVAERQLDENEL